MPKGYRSDTGLSFCPQNDSWHDCKGCINCVLTSVVEGSRGDFRLHWRVQLSLPFCFDTSSTEYGITFHFPFLQWKLLTVFSILWILDGIQKIYCGGRVQSSSFILPIIRITQIPLIWSNTHAWSRSLSRGSDFFLLLFQEFSCSCLF